VALHRNGRAKSLRAKREIVPEVLGRRNESDREYLVNSNFVGVHHFEGVRGIPAKALSCEKLAREATDEATKVAWEELANEWHILASRIANDDKDDEID
jgi:hypothetical protein